MRDIAFVFVAQACVIAFVPNLWLWCDRTLTRRRTAPPVTTPSVARPVPVTGMESLVAVARGIQAGNESTAALMAAPPCEGLSATQELVASGMNLAGALDTGTPEADILLSCLHHGQFSPGAIEHAVNDLLRESDFRRETQAAVAGSRASARMLTMLPFGFLTVALFLSADVRSGLGSPGGIVVLATGVFLNRVGSRWMSRTTERALRAGDDHIPVTSAATFIAHHVRAGGNVHSAFGLLARRSPDVAESAVLLDAGEPLLVALRPVARTMPGIANAILTAHHDGLPLEPQLITVAAESLHRRAHAVRAAVSRLPARTTVPLVTCVLPSFVLVALMPLVLAASGGHSLPLS